ncbi:MAG: glucose/arabinose dehydrogenase [Myxococcota bacterium]|jgi:glucose/arabinose dehydrogenase
MSRQRIPGLLKVDPPVCCWDPMITRSGMATPQGRVFPSWEGDLLIGERLRLRTSYQVALIDTLC